MFIEKEGENFHLTIERFDSSEPEEIEEWTFLSAAYRGKAGMEDVLAALQEELARLEKKE